MHVGLVENSEAVCALDTSVSSFSLRCNALLTEKHTA